MDIYTLSLNSTNTSNAATIAALLNPSTAAGVEGRPEVGSGNFIVCYSPRMITRNGVWRGDNPLDYTLPLFILQSIMVVVVTRGLNVFFRRLRQPRFVAEVIGGILLGPSVLGNIPSYMDMIFPMRSQPVIETLANLGLVYFIFLVGLQVDLGAVRRTGKKVWAVTASSIVVPFLVEILAYAAFGYVISMRNYVESYLVFIGVSISITAYPVLARILAELKLLHTETGRLAMSAAILNDGVAWILLAVAIALTGQNRSYFAPVAIIVSGVILVMVLYCTLRPMVYWFVDKTKEGEQMDDNLLQFICMGVMVFGILADSIGIHAVFGAFMVGVVIPNGPVVSVIMERMDDFVTGFLLPLFFVCVGINVDLKSLDTPGVFGFLIGVIVVAATSKVGAIVLASRCFGLHTRDGLSLGVLMNTKGIMELIVLHIALDKKVLYTQSYSTMVMMSVLMTAAVTPLSYMLTRSSRNFRTYKRRTIQKANPETELRVMACVHSIRNVPSIISLLEISHPTKRSPIFVHSVHLVELKGHESAMLIVNDSHHSFESNRAHFRENVPGAVPHGHINRVQTRSDQITKAFESYDQTANGVSVQPLTIVSPYSTMHEDVRDLVEDKRVVLLVLPFHKQHTVDGGLEVTNLGIQTFNRNMMVDSPCSVGLLVDRGIGGMARVSVGFQTVHHIGMLFIGGPDDWEALAYASRMSDHPNVSLTVVRFVGPKQQHTFKRSSSTESNIEEASILDVMTEEERERFFDDECIKEFRIKTTNNERVEYNERSVTSGEQMVEIIRSMDDINDLYIVGRGQRVNSELTAGMTDWTENTELGAIGDLLASEDFTLVVSVLVVQQYKGVGSVVEGLESPRTPSSSPGFDRVDGKSKSPTWLA